MVGLADLPRSTHPHCTVPGAAIDGIGGAARPAAPPGLAAADSAHGHTRTGADVPPTRTPLPGPRRPGRGARAEAATAAIYRRGTARVARLHLVDLLSRGRDEHGRGVRRGEWVEGNRVPRECRVGPG